MELLKEKNLALKKKKSKPNTLSTRAKCSFLSYRALKYFLNVIKGN